MKAIVRTNASVAWLVLVALTLTQWALGTSHGFGGHHAPASVVIIIVAVFKIRLIGLYFMELNNAPSVLRGVFEGYCAVLPILLSAMYLLA